MKGEIGNTEKKVDKSSRTVNMGTEPLKSTVKSENESTTSEARTPNQTFPQPLELILPIERRRAIIPALEQFPF